MVRVFQLGRMPSAMRRICQICSSPSGRASRRLPRPPRSSVGPAASALARREAGLFVLSLGSVCVFFAPPVFLMGMIGPWAVRLAGADRPDLGRVAGELSGIGALGSIAGTFISSLVLLPLLGTRTTILLTAALLAATGGWRAFGDFNLKAAGSLFLCAALPFAPVGKIKNEPGQLHETESVYQYVQVVVDPDGFTTLFLNEGECYHSVRPKRGHLTGGYWEHISILPAMMTKKGDPLRVLILGLAGGTMAWQLSHYYGDCRKLSIDGVEIDPAVIEAGKKYFGLNEVKNLKIHEADGRAFVLAEGEPYDIIVADAFRQPYIPFHMVTREFYRTCLNRLSDNGVFAINLGTDHNSPELFDAFAATLGSVFPKVQVFTKQGSTFDNHILLGSRHGLSLENLRDLAPALARVPLKDVEKTWRVPDPPADAFVFTDDHSPIEFFTERMILRGLLK